MLADLELALPIMSVTGAGYVLAAQEGPHSTFSPWHGDANSSNSSPRAQISPRMDRPTAVVTGAAKGAMYLALNFVAAISCIFVNRRCASQPQITRFAHNSD